MAPGCDRNSWLLADFAFGRYGFRMIDPPHLPDDHPDYGFECEQALDRAINDIGDAAVAAGWHDAAVDAALLRIVRDLVFGRIEIKPLLTKSRVLDR